MSLLFLPATAIQCDIFLEYPFQLQDFFPAKQQLFLQNRGFFFSPLSEIGWVVVAQARFPAQLGRALETSKLQTTRTKLFAWGEINASMFALHPKST